MSEGAKCSTLALGGHEYMPVILLDFHYTIYSDPDSVSSLASQTWPGRRQLFLSPVFSSQFRRSDLCFGGQAQNQAMRRPLPASMGALLIVTAGSDLLTLELPLPVPKAPSDPRRSLGIVRMYLPTRFDSRPQCPLGERDPAVPRQEFRCSWTCDPPSQPSDWLDLAHGQFHQIACGGAFLEVPEKDF
jgi:hypothetical protein